MLILLLLIYIGLMEWVKLLAQFLNHFNNEADKSGAMLHCSCFCRPVALPFATYRHVSIEFVPVQQAQTNEGLQMKCNFIEILPV